MTHDRKLTLSWHRPLYSLRSITLLAAFLHLPLQAAQAPQPLDAIRQAAEVFALGQLQNLGYQEMRAEAGGLDERLRLAPCELPLEAFATSVPTRAGRTSVGVRCNGNKPWTLYVPVAVTASTSVVVVQGPLPRGTVLTAEHLHVETQDLNTLPPRYLDSIDAVLGTELTRPISQQTVLTMAMVREKEVIAKGQDVMILANGGGFQVRMNGTALQAGKLGERINVRNANSGRTVQGVIRDTATVEVAL